jgi:hypothetical protein
MDDIATAADVEPFAREAVALICRSQETAAFKKHWIRLIGQADRLLPGDTWTYINEIFYAVEEHTADPESRERNGGLGDEDLRQAVASQLPALEEELTRLRAVEAGREPTAPARDPGVGTEMLHLVRELLAGTLPPPEFAVTYADRLERGRGVFTPRLQAAAEAIGLAIRHFRPGGTRLRMYDIDETVLCRRVADIEPRLAAAVES